MSEQPYYDAWTPDQVAALQVNEAQFCKLTVLGRQWMKDAFRQIRKDHPDWLQLLDDTSGWIDPDGPSIGTQCTYRLKPDWTRPEPEPEEWIYCPVRPNGTAWRVYDLPQPGFAWMYLKDAIGRIGCGGVEFKEDLGTFHGDGNIRYVSNTGRLLFSTTSDDKPPATPHRVKFHRATLVKYGIIS